VNADSGRCCHGLSATVVVGKVVKLHPQNARHTALNARSIISSPRSGGTGEGRGRGALAEQRAHRWTDLPNMANLLVVLIEPQFHVERRETMHLIEFRASGFLGTISVFAGLIDASDSPIGAGRWSIAEKPISKHRPCARTHVQSVSSEREGRVPSRRRRGEQTSERTSPLPNRSRPPKRHPSLPDFSNCGRKVDTLIVT
jgi:hypothetical protein